jgi:outer membrane biosynthesis protein TonB
MTVQLCLALTTAKALSQSLFKPVLLVTEETRMKVLGAISTTAMFLLLGTTVPAFAQEEHQQEGAKPAQHEEQAKPQKQEQQAKPAKQEQAKPEKQEQQAKSQEESQQKHTQQPAKSQQREETKEQQQQAKTQQNVEKSQQHQQQAKGQAQESQRQYARNGQKDRYGHEYNESHFGPDHHAHFRENAGRYYNGRREYSYGGYWFYAGAYPAWFYQQDVYFIMGADGLWYAVAHDNPSLSFQVNIG